MLLQLLLSSLAFLSPALASDTENYSELVKLKPLRDGKVLANWDFNITTPRWPASVARSTLPDVEEETSHYRLFPLGLAQLLRRYAVTEFHLSLNAGKWDYQAWGLPEATSVGGGAELWAWISSGGEESIDKRWLGLTNGLSGLFCASIGALDSKRTTSPKHTFRPEGPLPLDIPHHLLYAPLPSETVCTENLTPFLKLLPCKSRSGIAMLLNPHKLFDADWHGMSIHVLRSENGDVTLRMSVSAVFDPVRLSEPAHLKDWSLHSLFGTTVSRSCQVASSSEIWVYPAINDPFTIVPSPTWLSNGVSVFDLRDVRKPVDLSMKFQRTFMEYTSLTEALPLSIYRRLQGGQSSGTLSVHLSNRDSSSVEMLWLETMPWFITFYLHTLEAKVDGRTQSISNFVKIINYEAPRNRKPTLFEAILALPPNTSLVLSMHLTKASILYTDHPPDAARGWDLPSGLFTLPSSLPNEKHRRIYTNNLLADLPTPDFSMPYNVIIMTSTLVALFFGNILNLSTRSFMWIN